MRNEEAAFRQLSETVRTERNSQIIRLYQKGYPIRTIAPQVRLSEGMVREILKRNGVNIVRPKRYVFTTGRKEE